jgi:predicted adenine nucleotide alpha hydrolase (AANH) superfamily ATPase|uniref:Epoxyqueuosine reductase QueH n=1 Tax=Desulfobacca acetoxidans TaxID=60893 RepID=A0A7C5ALK3_9BACT
MKLLLHICCGPCAIYPVELLRAAGHQVVGYFYNPNIHPYQEFLRRKQALADYADTVGLSVIWEPGYEVEEYFRQVAFREGERCRLCYALRLARAVRTAREQGFEAFTTTLLYSRYQKHDLIREIAEELGSQAQLVFYYEDFRKGWSEGVTKSKEMGLYRQPYCGCLFSERERYSRPGREGHRS